MGDHERKRLMPDIGVGTLQSGGVEQHAGGSRVGTSGVIVSCQAGLPAIFPTWAFIVFRWTKPAFTPIIHTRPTIPYPQGPRAALSRLAGFAAPEGGPSHAYSCSACSRRRQRFSRPLGRCTRRNDWRGGVQPRHDRLSGNPDRPLVLPPDRHADVSPY